jgi:hypothetical protein
MGLLRLGFPYAFLRALWQRYLWVIYSIDVDWRFDTGTCPIATKAPYMVHGITAQTIKLNINVITRAIIKINKLSLLGKMGSFIINLKPYAKGYNNPNNPTTLGPFLRCMEAITLRSTKIKKATPSKRGFIIPIILAKIPMIYSLILLVFLKILFHVKSYEKKEIYISLC